MSRATLQTTQAIRNACQQITVRAMILIRPKIDIEIFRLRVISTHNRYFFDKTIKVLLQFT